MSAAVQAAGAQLPAAGSSFYLGMRILPKAQREAMYAVYAFCRAVDDIADEGGERPDRLRDLAAWRGEIDALYAGEVTSRTSALAIPVRAFRLPREAFHDVIDGMAMDAEADIRAPSWADLDLYCDRVASAVGRLSTRIFGVPEPDGDLLAHHLGRALQLTNILRDLDADAAIGRLYLPREALVGAAIAEFEPSVVLAHPALAAACAHVVTRAHGHFAEAERVMARQRRSTVRAPRLMAAAYKSVLDRLSERGFGPPRVRVRTGKLRLLAALIRHGFA